MRKFEVSIGASAIISFFAWIAVQLHIILGAILFLSALIVPPIVFREYYQRRPRMLVPFFAVSFVLAVLLTPPLVIGPSVEFGLHQATGCWEREGDTWPLEGESNVAYSCSQFLDNSTVRVTGMAWKSVRIRLPLPGRFVTLYEPRGKMQKTYKESIKRAESEGYTRLVEGYGSLEGLIGDVLLIKGDECIYLAEAEVLGGGLAVVSARGHCPGVKAFALRRHTDYLWNESEPPILERYRFNWSLENGIKVGRFHPSDWPDEWVKNTYKAIEIELKGTGYVKQMEGESGDCMWSLWTRGEKSHYVSRRGKEILVIRGETRKVENSAGKISPCGMKNAREVHEPTPDDVLDSVVSDLNTTFNISLAEWSGPSPGWHRSRRDVRVILDDKREVNITLLAYALSEQCHYARYTMETSDWTVTSICVEYDGYFVVVAVDGRVEDTRFVLSSISQPQKS